MLNFSIELLEKSFTAKNMKEAYMKAVKWYATNVLAKDELHNVMVEYKKDKQSPTITIHLYISMAEEEIRQEHCKICKEFHNSFFINNVENCNNCNLIGYQKRLDNKIQIKKEFYKELLNQRGIF